MSRIIGEKIQRVKKTVEKLHIRQSNDSPNGTLTRQYGFIKFNENELDETTRVAQYIHLALATDAETVVKFMKDAWHLRTPDLIISIAGSTQHFDLSARLKKSFQLGLVSAAATTNAWIITAGINAGVVKEVGEALSKYRYKNQKDGIDIPCIGIASWDYIAGKDQLDQSISKTSNNHNTIVNTPSKKYQHNIAIDAIQMSGDAIYGIRTYIVKQKEENKCDLEPNHTHFLLFDDGTSNSENLLPLRTDIEMHSRYTNIKETIEGAVHTLIPIVMVLVEGGRSSIQHVCKALDLNTPVVIVKESGHAADLIADLHACFSEDDIDYVTDNNNEDSKRSSRSSFVKTGLLIVKINAIFAKARIHNPWVDDVRDDLCQRLDKCHKLITIFKFDSKLYHGKLEESILEAVFNAAKISHGSNEQYRSAAELKLALAWHNVEYARRAIFTDLSILKWRGEDLRQALLDALRRGYVDFIELFLEYGITLEKLTIRDLEYLYISASIDKVLPLRKIRYTLPTRDEFYAEYMGNHLKIYNETNIPLGDHAIRDLFIWAIFLDRFDFALYLCSKTWNQSVAPLFGAQIYRKAAAMTLDSETKQQYEKNA
ncbi:unnamed protein product, partial [Rotaria sp. Silwood1]